MLIAMCCRGGDASTSERICVDFLSIIKIVGAALVFGKQATLELRAQILERNGVEDEVSKVLNSHGLNPLIVVSSAMSSARDP
jgi:hypothetical protein